MRSVSSFRIDVGNSFRLLILLVVVELGNAVCCDDVA